MISHVVNSIVDSPSFALRIANGAFKTVHSLILKSVRSFTVKVEVSNTFYSSCRRKSWIIKANRRTQYLQCIYISRHGQCQYKDIYIWNSLNSINFIFRLMFTTPTCLIINWLVNGNLKPQRLCLCLWRTRKLLISFTLKYSWSRGRECPNENTLTSY